MINSVPRIGREWKRWPAAAVEPADEYEGNPIVGFAVRELNHFGRNLDRDTAADLLDVWRHRDQLSPREYLAVLRRFPEPAAPEEMSDFYDPAVDHRPGEIWISDSNA